MKISYRSLPKVWLAVVVVFTAASALWFGYLWVNSGGKIPGITNAGYRVSFPAKDVDNLVYFNDVRMAGVKVGKVVEVANAPGAATLTIELDPRVAPLHEGVTLRIGAKSLVEESYVDEVKMWCPGPVQIAHSGPEALAAARKAAPDDAVVLGCGSLFLVGQLRASLVP